ncbi:sensor histidine kinase [Aestuariibacter salexigens]|uniref:sensor histidine kinase n=1 Tax=Aestuariibacter salexigens TaxID=226010 RepID=UPI0004149A24|nr:histidine kinase [Aestuariibacter salexigens]
MAKIQDILRIDRERISAIATWLVVMCIALYYMAKSENYPIEHLLITGGLFVIFIALWMQTTSDSNARPTIIPTTENQYRLVLLVIEYGCIIALYYMVPFSFVAILCVIWSAQLPYFFSLRTALWSSPLWSAPLWLVHTYHWGEQHAHIMTLLFWTFNLFALVTINTLRNEQEAREAANQLNRELMATQDLLQQATRQAERVRIARNIHDLLGHHLTALTIKLQVAQRTCDTSLKGNIDECYQLAKLLLSDVREAVSEIRERGELDLEQALNSLFNNVEQLDITFNIEQDCRVDDVATAEALLRCIQESLTNSLRHAQASTFSVNVQRRNGQLHCTIADNGTPDKTFTPGNGLNGIAERVNALGGRVDFAATASGFITQIWIPEAT